MSDQFWNNENVNSVVHWWHTGASQPQIGRYMNRSRKSIDSILRKIARACGLVNASELLAFDPDEIVSRYISHRTMSGAEDRTAAPKKRLCNRNQRFLSLLTIHHDHMFNGQPVPAEARELARVVLGRGA